MRERSRRSRYYAVAVGIRPGIYTNWKAANANVNEYSKNSHKSFKTLGEAQEFMAANRAYPPAVRTPFRASNAPLPPPNLNPMYGDDYYSESSEEEHTVVDHAAATEPRALEMPRMAIVAPPTVSHERFARIVQMSERIAARPANRVLDPGTFVCPNRECGFCSGDLWRQRFLLMQRLFQLNSQLAPASHQQQQGKRTTPYTYYL